MPPHRWPMAAVEVPRKTRWMRRLKPSDSRTTSGTLNERSPRRVVCRTARDACCAVLCCAVLCCAVLCCCRSPARPEVSHSKQTTPRCCVAGCVQVRMDHIRRYGIPHCIQGRVWGNEVRVQEGRRVSVGSLIVDFAAPHCFPHSPRCRIVVDGLGLWSCMVRASEVTLASGGKK